MVSKLQIRIKQGLILFVGERPYTCWCCEHAKFSRKDNLVRHVEKTHGHSKEFANRLANAAFKEYLEQKKKEQERLQEVKKSGPIKKIRICHVMRKSIITSDAETLTEINSGPPLFYERSFKTFCGWPQIMLDFTWLHHYYVS